METSAYGDPYKSCSSYTALRWAGKTRILSSNTKNSMDTKCQVILLQFKCRTRVCTPRTGWPFHPLYYRSVLKTKLTCSSLSLLQITRCTVPALPRPAPVVTAILSSPLRCITKIYSSGAALIHPVLWTWTWALVSCSPILPTWKDHLRKSCFTYSRLRQVLLD